MTPILAIGEVSEGRPTRLTLEIATLAMRLVTSRTQDAHVLLVGRDLTEAGAEVAAHGPQVLLAEAALDSVPFAAAAVPPTVALIERLSPRTVLLGASQDGRDLAGALVGLTDLPVLAAATGVEVGEGSLRVEMSTWGGRLTTTSVFAGERGIVLVRPGAVAPVLAPAPGPVAVEASAAKTTVSPGRALPEVRIVDRVAQATGRASIDDARVIVAGGRGIGGPEGFGLLEALAHELGGAVGATRAAVDSGWVDFGQQIGQTGKTVRPDLYIACGISGAIQHRVGIQSGGTIVAINRDADAPVAGFADMLVVGDLFEIVPRLTEAIRTARRDGR